MKEMHFSRQITNIRTLSFVSNHRQCVCDRMVDSVCHSDAQGVDATLRISDPNHPFFGETSFDSPTKSLWFRIALQHASSVGSPRDILRRWDDVRASLSSWQPVIKYLASRTRQSRFRLKCDSAQLREDKETSAENPTELGMQTDRVEGTVFQISIGPQTEPVRKR
jgi:hypothetical protein